jgi:hypothetical protein
MKRSVARRNLAHDILFIAIGVFIAIIISRSGLLDQAIALIGNGVIAVFIAGFFFTSAFTIAPASVAFARMASSMPASTLALWGALGALCGDLVLFFFIRDRFADDLKHSLKPSFVKHIAHSFHFGFLKWLSPLIGAVVIASPLPDEIGLTLLGLSKTRLILLVPIAFVMNTIGIYILVSFALMV